jgi:hypothetical protein
MAEHYDNRQAEEVLIGEDKEARARARVKRNLQRARKKNGQYFNLFDLFVIFVVLVSLTLLILGVRVSDIFGAGDEGRACRLEYQVRFTAVDENLAKAVTLGDALYDTDTKVGMGRVAAQVKMTPAMTVVSGTSAQGSTAGEAVMLDGKVDMLVTVSVDAIYVEGVGYTVGGRPVRVGNSYTLRFPGYLGDGICVSLRELNTAQ